MGPNNARRNLQRKNRGMMDQSFGSNMSYRTDALMARPSPYGYYGEFASICPAPFASEGSLHFQSYYSADGPQPLMQNFTKFYNDPSASGHKRRSEDRWQEDWLPKRFRGPGDRWSLNHGQNRSLNRHRGGRGRNFNPTRVKPPTSYPAASLDKTKPGKKYNVLLTADNPPSPRVEGILEMALGTIFKDVHKLHPETAPPLPFLVLRNIKQTIRDRIREVMIGRVVGRFDDVVKAYRVKYAADTDKEVLASAESRPVPKRKFIDQSASPRVYFETNLPTLLRKKIDEMFDKLKGLYNKEQLKENLKETMEEMQAEDEAKLLEAEESDKASFTADVDIKNKGATNEDKAEETEAVKEEKTEGKEAEVRILQYRSKYYQKLMQDLIRMQLPNALPNYKEKILDLLDIDEEYKQTKFCDALLSRIFDESPDKYYKTNMSTLRSKKMDEMFDKLKGLYNEEQFKENIKQTIEEMQAEDKAKSAKAEEAEKASITTDVDIEYKVATKEEKAEGKEAVKEEKAEGKEAEVKTVQYSSKYYEKLMQDLIKMQLPDALPKYKETILALLDLDEEYKQTKASIILKTDKIASHNTKDDSEVTELGSKLDNKIDDLLRSIRKEEEKLTTPEGEH